MDNIKIIEKKPDDLIKIEYILKTFLAEEDYELFEIGINDLGEFGSKLSEPVIHIIDVLFNIGMDTSKRELDHQTKIVINNLGKIGNNVIDRKLTDALSLLLKSIGDLGVKAVENKWNDTTKLSIDILGDLYVAACKNKKFEREVNRVFVYSIQNIASASMSRDIRFAIDCVAPSLNDLSLKLIEQCLKEIKMKSNYNMYNDIRRTIDYDIAVVGIGNILSKALEDKVIDKMSHEFEDLVKYIANIGAEIAVVDNFEYVDGHKTNIDLNRENWCTLRLKGTIDGKNHTIVKKFVMIIENFCSELSGASEIENLSLRYHRELFVKYCWTIRLLKGMGDKAIDTSEETIDRIESLRDLVNLEIKKNEKSRAQSGGRYT